MILNSNISLHTTSKNITLLVASVLTVLERFRYFSPSFTFSCSLNQIVGSQIFSGGFFFQLSFMMTFIVSFKFSDEIFRHFRLSLLRYKDQWLVMSTFNDPGVRHFKLIALTNTYLDHFLILQIEESRSMLTLEKKVVITSCFSRDSMQWISYPHCVRDHVPGNTAFNCLNTTLQVQY